MPAQSSNGLGGAFVTIIDNTLFLESLRRDVAEGVEGPRGSVIMDDLRALRVVIDQETERRNGPTA